MHASYALLLLAHAALIQLAFPHTDSNYYTSLHECEAEIRDERAYRTVTSATPRICRVVIYPPKDKRAKITIAHHKAQCIKNPIPDSMPRIEVVDMTTNRTNNPCDQLRQEVQLRSKQGPIVIIYTASKTPFLFSIRFYSTVIGCGDRLEYIQFGQPLLLRNGGEERCKLNLPGESAVTVFDMYADSKECDASFTFKMGETYSAMRKQSAPHCRVDKPLKTDLFCKAAALEIRAPAGEDVAVRFEVQLFDFTERLALVDYDMCY